MPTKSRQLSWTFHEGPLKSMLICKYQNKPIFIRIKGDISDIDSPVTSWKPFSKGKPKSGKLSAFFIQKKINSSTSDTGLFTKVNRNLLKTGSLPAFFRSSIKTDVQLQCELVISKIPWTTLSRSEDSAIATLFNFGLVYTQCQGMLNSFLKEIRYNFYVNL